MKTINDYADLVKEQHTLNTTIAPVETDLTSASKAYAVGQKFIYDGVLYQAKTAIAQGAALVLNTNYEAADDVSSEIQTLTNEVDTIVNNLSAKNILDIDLTELKALNTNGTWADNIYTFRNVTFTVNNDKTITVSGTASDPYPYFYLKQYTTTNKCPFIGKKVILNGCPAGGSNSTYRLRFTKMDGTNEYNDYGNGTPAVTVEDGTQTTGNQQIYISVYSISAPITFKPMVRDGSIVNGDYVPYAMTNRELTDKVMPIEGKYVVVGVNRNVYVTSDGVKTVKDLLNDLASTYIAMVEALPDGEATSVTGVNVYVPTASAASAFPSITTFSRGLNTNSNTSSLNVIFRGFVLDTSKLYAVNVKVHSTLSSCEIKGYDLLNNNLKFDDGSEVISSGTIFTLYYTEYTKVS